MYRELRDGNEVKLWVTAPIDDGRLVTNSESRYVPEHALIGSIVHLSLVLSRTS